MVLIPCNCELLMLELREDGEIRKREERETEFEKKGDLRDLSLSSLVYIYSSIYILGA